LSLILNYQTSLVLLLLDLFFSAICICLVCRTAIIFLASLYTQENKLKHKLFCIINLFLFRYLPIVVYRHLLFIVIDCCLTTNKQYFRYINDGAWGRWWTYGSWIYNYLCNQCLLLL